MPECVRLHRPGGDHAQANEDSAIRNKQANIQEKQIQKMTAQASQQFLDERTHRAPEIRVHC